MISETYLKLLKSEVKKIDELTNSTYEFEIILQDIVDNVKNSELEFVKRLGNLSNNAMFPTMKDKQSNILEILYKYLGARVIDTNYAILKETNTKSFEILSNELNSLIGLENVKEEIEGLVIFNKIQKVRENLGLKKTNRSFAIFLAAALGDLLTYVTTSIQLGLAFPDPNGGFLLSASKFMGIFAVTQVPLAISEGLLTVVVFNILMNYNKETLNELEI